MVKSECSFMINLHIEKVPKHSSNGQHNIENDQGCDKLMINIQHQMVLQSAVIQHTISVALVKLDPHRLTSGGALTLDSPSKGKN